MPSKITDFRLADEDHAVVTVERSGKGHGASRREACAECPWRLDSPVGAFPAEAYRLSANTATDAATHTFACHMSGREKPATCAGFILAQGRDNLGIRIGFARGRVTMPLHTMPLYANYRAMAVANGVDPADPAIARCRDDSALVEDPACPDASGDL